MTMATQTDTRLAAALSALAPRQTNASVTLSPYSYGTEPLRWVADHSGIQFFVYHEDHGEITWPVYVALRPLGLYEVRCGRKPDLAAIGEAINAGDFELWLPPREVHVPAPAPATPAERYVQSLGPNRRARFLRRLKKSQRVES